MSIRNLVKVVKRDVLKVKEPEVVKDIVAEKESYDGSLLSGYSSYRFHQTYSDLAAKYMTRTFNAICSEAGVQCTVAMDPSDYQQIYHFKNLGDRLVKIEWNDEVRFIEPGESVTLKTRGSSIHQEIPSITPLNNGYDNG